MYCTYTLTIACMKMFLRNRQAIFFSLFFPILILLFFGSIDFDSPARPRIGLVVARSFARNGAVRGGPPQHRVPDDRRGNDGGGKGETGGRQSDRGARYSGRSVFGRRRGRSPQIAVYVNAARPMEAKMAMSILNQLADRATLSAMNAPALFTFKEKAVNARHLRYIDFLLPGVMAMSIMQMSVFSVAFVFARGTRNRGS